MPQPLHRDLDRLAAQAFDLLVIGGGIYGLTVACDAAQRGLAVALVERNDFGSGTSFNHLRTIHGGLRYLQTLDIARARESVRERRTLARIAPWAVRPLPFVLPLYPSLTKGTLALRAGLFLDSIVAIDRNNAVPDSHRLPAGYVLGRDEARRRYPELQSLPITSAAVWYDYVTTQADRLTLAWGLSAAEHGAALANYVEVTALSASNGRVDGAHATDRTTGRDLHIRARAVVNATGGGINRLLAPFGAQVALPLLQAVNVVTTRPAPAMALGGRGASGRNLFLVPWQGRALFGTWESPRTCDADDVTIRNQDLESLLAELNTAFPTFGLTRADVSLIHRGVVPAVVRKDAAPTLDGGELVFEHRAHGLAGLLSVAGTKYTTARAVAERIVGRVLALLGRPAVASRTGSLALPHVALTGDALLQHAASHEMVVTLADALLRRTPIGAVGLPPDDVLTHGAAIVGAALGWSDARQRDEVAAVHGLY